MSVTVYSSADVGAPTLSNALGSVAAILDACLVNGYGSKVAAGWSIPFTGTNQRTYRAASGNQYYLNIDDSLATNFYARGFEAMTAWNTGVNAFPTTSQISGTGCTYARPTTSAAHGWWVIATPTFFYFLWDQTNLVWSPTSSLYGFFFGDFPSYKSSDPYSTIISAGTQQYVFTCSLGNATGFAYRSGYLARKFDGISISSPSIFIPICGYCCYPTNGQPIGNPANPFAYPDTVSSSLLLTPFYLVEYTGSNPAIRGWMPGLYGSAQYAPLNQADIFTGVSGSNLSGKTLQTFANIWNTTSGQIFIETSDTWLSTMWQ